MLVMLVVLVRRCLQRGDGVGSIEPPVSWHHMAVKPADRISDYGRSTQYDFLDERIIAKARFEPFAVWKRALACWTQLRIMQRQIGERWPICRWKWWSR